MVVAVRVNSELNSCCPSLDRFADYRVIRLITNASKFSHVCIMPLALDAPDGP